MQIIIFLCVAKYVLFSLIILFQSKISKCQFAVFLTVAFHTTVHETSLSVIWVDLLIILQD